MVGKRTTGTTTSRKRTATNSSKKPSQATMKALLNEVYTLAMMCEIIKLRCVIINKKDRTLESIIDEAQQTLGAVRSTVFDKLKS